MGKQILNGIVYGGVGEEYLSNLSDVELANLQDGQGLLYDSALQKWVNAVVGSGGSGSGGAVGIRDVTSLITLYSGVTQNPDVNNFTYKAWQIGNTVFLNARGNLSNIGNPDNNLYSILTADSTISPQKVTDNAYIGNNRAFQMLRIELDGTIKITDVDTAGNAWLSINVAWQVANTLYANTYHNYSTEEQVIGTWIDGKPLYEKTVYFTTPTQSQANTEIIVGNIGINNATILRQEYTFYCNGTLSHSYNDGVLERDGWKSVTARIVDGYIYVEMITGSGNVKYYAYCEQNAFVIVQYTKTTDTAQNT